MLPNITSSKKNYHRTSEEIIKSIKAQSDKERSHSEVLADFITKKIGTVTFLTLNLAVFSIWIVFNSNFIPNLDPFDPFPFNLLTMIVSLEAIVLGIVVLISQNRETKVADLREEIDLQINTISEKEITKLMKMVLLLLEKNGIDISKDEELKHMLHYLNTDKMEKKLKEEIE